MDIVQKHAFSGNRIAKWLRAYLVGVLLIIKVRTLCLLKVLNYQMDSALVVSVKQRNLNMLDAAVNSYIMQHLQEMFCNNQVNK